VIPLYGVSEAGVVAEIAGLRALAHGGYLLDPGGEAPWLGEAVGRKGRRAAFSLALVDAEFGGEGQGWMRAGTTLHREGLLGAQSLERLVRAETFGTWIGNSDMHLGNISVAPTTDGFELLPLYDMLPMAFAPVRGELPRPRLRPPLQTAGNASFWSEMGAAAGEFWQRVAADGAVSRNFRGVAEEQARRSPES
jgi:hypothetical protein